MLREILDKTNLRPDQVGEYTGQTKDIRPVTVSTYQILTYRRSRQDVFVHFGLFDRRDWGLIIYDEVHLLPAPVFQFTADIQARRRLGLTATLVREDGREDDVFALIGPKKYDVPWKVMEKQGWTCFGVAGDGKLIGIVAVADEPRPESCAALAELRRLGLHHMVMLTGDNARVAESVASKLGVDHVYAGLLPEEKSEAIGRAMEEFGCTAMVGDGINDAPALTQADIGIAIGSGTDVAIESGNIVLIKDDLRDVVTAMDLSRFAMRKIKQNLFWAFFYNSIGIPLAAGVLYPFTGWLLSPIIAGIAMAFSSVSVVSNSLLMKRYKPKLR